MTSEEKAVAWKWAAHTLEIEIARVESELGTDGETQHVRNVVIPHLRRQAERIRSSSKARRERESQ